MPLQIQPQHTAGTFGLTGVRPLRKVPSRTAASAVATNASTWVHGTAQGIVWYGVYLLREEIVPGVDARVFAR
jgi:hypothetical protein